MVHDLVGTLSIIATLRISKRAKPAGTVRWPTERADSYARFVQCRRCNSYALDDPINDEELNLESIYHA